MNHQQVNKRLHAVGLKLQDLRQDNTLIHPCVFSVHNLGYQVYSTEVTKQKIVTDQCTVFNYHTPNADAVKDALDKKLTEFKCSEDPNTYYCNLKDILEALAPIIGDDEKNRMDDVACALKMAAAAITN